MKTKDLKSGMTVRHQEWDSSRKPMQVVETGKAGLLLKNLQDDTLPLTSPRASGEEGWILVYQLDESSIGQNKMGRTEIIKQIIYLLMAVIGLIGTISGTIKLSSLSYNDGDIIPMFFLTLISMAVFILFGYAFSHTFLKRR